LAAILAADVVGYSRLMGEDEVGTLEGLKAHRSQLIDPKIREHHGRIVKTTGDGLLVEFGSVVDAVRCGVEVQRGMVERNAGIPEDQRILLRVGINLGDVIIDGDDIHGDGVNVAARLEGLAEPGGLCISRSVRDQVQDKLPYSFEDMGEQSVKNIARPVRTDALSALAVAATSLVAVSDQAPTNAQSPPTVANTQATMAPRLSIVVLPFANLSNDPEQDYFVDAITDDLTTDLSYIVNSFVIARATAFTYKGKAIDVKQIGEELGVRYVLEGSVRRTGDRIRANVQLIDTESGTHVWAGRFDVNRADLAKAQDEIVARLARTLQVEMLEAAARRIELERPANTDASDFVMRGWARFYLPASDAHHQEAKRAFERALEIDPQSVEAKLGFATVIVESVAQGRSRSPNQDMAQADKMLAEATERGRNNPRALYALGMLRRLQNRLTESKVELEAALALNSSDTPSIMSLGVTLVYLGQPEAAIPYFEKKIHLDPHWHNISYGYWWLAYCHLLLGKTDEAIDFLQKTRAANPQLSALYLTLAAAHGLKGDINEAKANLDQSLKQKPEWNSLAQIHKISQLGSPSPQFVMLREKTLDVGLRRTGMPDE
jgi:TolB-like protein/class 3 adenylate cyclase/Tfp pilus assembly protein PilF